MKPLLTTLGLVVSTSFAFAQITTLPYMQDFEGGTFLPQDWEAFGSNANAAWQHSTTIGAYGNSSSCAYFDNFTTDLSGNYYGMRAVILDLTGTTMPTLTFDVAYARKSASNSDRLGIWYSLNGTTGWTNVINYLDGALTTAPDQTSYFIPSNSEWDSITLDLSAFAGTSLIRFAFENNCDYGNVMYIDNVHFYDNATTTSIIPDEETGSFDVYPNPSAGVVSISTNEAEVDEIQIHSIIGQQFYDFEINKHNGVCVLDLCSFPKGAYFISLIAPNQHAFSKMIVLE